MYDVRIDRAIPVSRKALSRMTTSLAEYGTICDANFYTVGVVIGEFVICDQFVMPSIGEANSLTGVIPFATTLENGDVNGLVISDSICGAKVSCQRGHAKLHSTTLAEVHPKHS